MTALRRHWPVIAILLGPVATLSAGCVAGGYGYADGGAYSVDYYEPYGYDYGYWGSGYEVGPYGYRGDHRGGSDRGEHGGSHAYRSAPASHSAPSIPTAPRSSGGGSRSRSR